MRRAFLTGCLFTTCLFLGCAHDRSYFLSLGYQSDKAPSATSDRLQPCTIYLGDLIANVLDKGDIADLEEDIKKNLMFDVHRPSDINNNPWTLRKFEIKLEHQLDSVIQRQGPSCQDHDKSLFKKWLATYSLNGTDPDQDINRFEEYLESVKRVVDLANRTGPDAITADQNEVFQKEGKNKSQWCGNPHDQVCPEQDWQLYKFISQVNPQFASSHEYGEAPLESVMLDRVQHAKEKGSETKKDNAQPRRFYILGYELPWDKQETEVRYGITFYFEESKKVGQLTSSAEVPLQYIGYRTIYANEATPKEFVKPGHASREQQLEASSKPFLNVIPRPIWYATGYPFAAVIGIKNAVFEVAKTPFSWLGGVVGGRDSALKYPAENLVNAYKALYVETSNLPSYGMFTGLYHLLTEMPFVGQVFQLNTGPEHETRDLPSVSVARKLFLSRGIYGGNEAGQDTGLWAAYAHRVYPEFDIYAPPYKHGTVTDVVWSMFNLSHGPGYAEAKYAMEKAGPYDYLYLSGHSGGVQRSASASRILANHGYSVIKVLGIAGPSIGQAYVDTGYENPFQIFLNTESGANEDITSQIGRTASLFSTIMQYAVLTPVKFSAGMITSPIPDLQRCTYQVFDHMGFSNAVVTEVPRKRSSLHQTPLRLSLNEPIVFDAYNRTEFETAFREDLMRPSDTSLPKLFGDGDSPSPLLGTMVQSSKGCTLLEHKSGAVIRWNH